MGSSDKDQFKPGSLINTLISRQGDGFIIFPTKGTMGQIRESFKMKIPFVLVDRYFPKIKASQVVMDNFRATWDVVTRLIGAGYRESHKFFYGVTQTIMLK